MLSSGRISVVVQGPISGGPYDPHRKRLTLRGLESVRRHLPDSEIVLSTWRGSDVSGLPFDRLVESEDPGGMSCDQGNRPRTLGPCQYNTNRQIVSTRAGLLAASREYAMKLRSDMELTGTGFLRYFGRYPARAGAWRIFRERVVTPTYFARNPHRYPYPFNPSDWFHFGRREDLLALWDIPLADQEMVRWFEARQPPREDPLPWPTYRYTAEQYIWLSFLRKHAPVACDHRADVAGDAIAVSELTIANNLVIAEVAELGISFRKYPISLVEWATLYTHGEWERLYRKYCDPDFRCAPDFVGWRKGAYGALLAPAHQVLLSPRSMKWVAGLNSRWERRFPRSFGVARSAYLASVSFFGRLARR